MGAVGANIPPSLLAFVGEQFRTGDDLRGASTLETKLRYRCSELEAALSSLDDQLRERLYTYALHSETSEALLAKAKERLYDLRSCSSKPSPSDVNDRERGGEEGSGRSELVMAEELPALAREVARVETVRAYVETALKLDSLIGDVEDAVSFSMTGKNRLLSAGNSEEMQLVAINSLKNTENILASITRSRHQWNRLISAADDRLDRALAILRPQTIADHRSLLNSLGWPPPLLSSKTANQTIGKVVMGENPLVTMNRNMKSMYSESFLALCNLQEFQRQRNSRQLVHRNLEAASHQPLWAIEELVNPISLASQHYFSKWIEKPEFIFALVYKVTRDFVNFMDEILQPLVDKARLVGYSCREEWISAMVTSLSTYLAKEIFPKYVMHLEEESSTACPSQARISWLHFIDQMIIFDKRVQSLITNSGFPMSLGEAILQRVSSLSVFCDRLDWLEIWAEMELSETVDRLRPELEDERNWRMRIEGTSLLYAQEDYKSPAISSAVLHHLSALVDRCRPLPDIPLRAKFVKIACAPIVNAYLDSLLHRCQEAEGLTALVDEDAMIKVCNSINGARYCVSVLTEWCEDMFFLEMVNDSFENVAVGYHSIFQDDISKLKGFHQEWLDKISTVILRGFDAQCRDYLKNKKQWQEKADGWNVSKSFINALNYLQAKTSKLEVDLNQMDFVGLWRSLASGIDQIIFNGVLVSSAKFYNGGVERLGADVGVLFGVFSSWCRRPDGFFPKISEGLRLLKMDEGELRGAPSRVSGCWLRQKGIRHLTSADVEKIVKNRVFVG